MSGRHSARRNTGRWTQEEHENFLKGIQQLGRNWDAIHALYVTSRNETQIRTHAQKYFLKIDRGLSFPEEPYGSANPRENADTSAQDSGNSSEGDQKTFYSDDAAAPTVSEGRNHFLVPPSTPAGAGAGAAAAAAGAAGNHLNYATRGIPAGDYAYVPSPFQGAPPPFSGGDQLGGPLSPDFGTNPNIGSGLPGWQFQMTPEGMGGGMVGGGAAEEPGNGPEFGNRHAAGLDSTEEALLAAVADMDDYDSGTSFSHFDTGGGSPASWTGYNAGGTFHGPPPGQGQMSGPWMG